MIVHEDNNVVMPLKYASDDRVLNHNNGMVYYQLGNLLYRGDYWTVFCCYDTELPSLTPMLTNIEMDEKNKVMYFTNQITKTSDFPMLTHMVILIRDDYHDSSSLYIMNLDSRRSWSDPLTVESNTVVAIVGERGMISNTSSELRNPVLVIDGLDVQRDVSQKIKYNLFKSGRVRFIKFGWMTKSIPVIHCRIEDQTASPNIIMDFQVGFIIHTLDWRNSSACLYDPSGGNNNLWAQNSEEISNDIW